MAEAVLGVHSLWDRDCSSVEECEVLGSLWGWHRLGVSGLGTVAHVQVSLGHGLFLFLNNFWLQFVGTDPSWAHQL